MVEDDHVLKTLRAMSFCRICGEILGMLNTYRIDEEKYEKFKKLSDDFIKSVNEDELHL